MHNLVAGCDEAGRGPLVGDMFVAVVVLPRRAEALLANAGVRDSKKLSPAERRRVLSSIISISTAMAVGRVPPKLIDRENINKLYVDTLCRLLRSLSRRGVRPEVIYVDAAGPEYRLASKLASCIDHSAKIVAEHRADEKYIPVAAASILAKVLRDEHIELLKKVYGDLGSGYPSDPRTRNWLKRYYEEHGELPPIVRRSWSTIKKVLGIEPTRKGRNILSYLR